MNTLDLNGIFPPIPTPFEGDQVAYEKLATNLEKWTTTGIKGLVVFGSNGEYPLLSYDEKCQVVQTVVQATPRHFSIIVGSGCESTKATIELTNACAKLGANAALVVTPHYYGNSMTPATLVRHFTEVADQSDIPIVLYNVTKFTHINLAPIVVAQLSHHPNIIGIKDSSGNVSQLGDYLNVVDEGFHVMVGTAGALLGALSLGCAGGVLALANVAPTLCVKIYDLVAAGHYEEAKRYQLQMIPVNKAITATYGIAGLKTALDLLGYYGGPPRLPLLPSTEAEQEAIRTLLQQANLL